MDLTDPSNPYIVSSQIKDTYHTVWNIIDEFFGGSWSTDNAVWGISENVIGAVHVTHESENPVSDRLTEEELAQVKEAAEKIRSGELNLTDMPEEADYVA